MTRRITSWAQHYKQQRQRQDQALAEGQSRPAPTGKPPMTYNEHFDLQVARIKDREAAAQDQQTEDNEEQS